MPTQNTLVYYPSLDDLITVDDLTESLSFIKTGLETILSKSDYA